MHPVIDVKNLTVQYKTPQGAINALRDFSFHVNERELYGLVGESGSGKSTAAWVIMRYLSENGTVVCGKILFHGQDLLNMNESDLQTLRGKKISMVYQDPMTSLNPAMTVGRQVQEVLDVHENGKKKETWDRAVEMLDKVQIADPALSARKFPHELSGGQQQRVVIAMALICNPDLLILDEPTTGLDVTTEATILDLIEDLKGKFSSAILFISHNLGVIARVADRVGVVYAGRMMEEGPVREIFRRPLHPYTGGLLHCIPRVGQSSQERLSSIRGSFPSLLNLPTGCVFHPRCPLADRECSVTTPNLSDIGLSRITACLRWRFMDQRNTSHTEFSLETDVRAKQHSREIAEKDRFIIELENVKKYYGGVGFLKRIVQKDPGYIHAVDGITLGVRPGQVFGLVGESGCGKSTIARSVAKLHRITAGVIRYEGHDIRAFHGTANREYHKNVQIVFQNPDSSFNPRKTIRQILARPIQLHRNLKGANLDDSIVNLLEMVKLSSSYLDRFPHQLSGGEKQRVGIARAFATEPKFLVCDEPVSAVDVSVQAAILNLIIDLQRSFGVALLFISHDLSVVRFISNNVGIMYLGKLVEIGEVGQVFSPPFHPYTQALLSAVPSLDPKESTPSIRLAGSVPSAKRPPTGCRFHTRCPEKIGSVCEQVIPAPHELSPGHLIYCHLFA